MTDDSPSIGYEHQEVPRQSLNDFLCNRNESIVQTWDADIAVCVNHAITYFVHVPLCVLGTSANIVVMWVWSSEREYYPTTYLFKAQALADCLFMITYILWQAVSGTFVRDILFLSATTAMGEMGVQITMLLAVVRLINLFFPFQFERLLSRLRLKLVLGGFAVWDITLSHYAHYLRITGSKNYRLVNMIGGELVSVFIPAVIQISVVAVVVWKAWRMFRIEPSQSRQGAEPFQQDQWKARRLLYTVLSMCVSTFIAHVVGKFIILILTSERLHMNVHLQSHRLVVYASVSILVFIDTSINIVFYSLFVTRFKVLLIKKLRKCRQKALSQSISAGLTLPEDLSIPDGVKTFFQANLPVSSTESKVPACSWEKTVVQTSASHQGISSFDTYIT